MFKKPENIAPLPSGMMDAFDRAVEQQISPYDVPLSQRPIAEEPKAEESIDLEEDAKTLTANRPLRQGKAQYKADNEKSTKEKTKEVEALVSEGTLKVTNYSGSDAGGQSPKSQGIKVKKVASGRYGDDVEMTGPDAKLIAFAIANLGVDKSAKTIADAQKQINESKKIASEDDTKEKYRTAGKKSEKEMTKDTKSLEESDDDKELDKVDSKAAKKKFKDREDKDIDNDGDEDESDKYLHLRRKAIAKAIDKKVQESVELDEDSDENSPLANIKKPKDPNKPHEDLHDRIYARLKDLYYRVYDTKYQIKKLRERGPKNTNTMSQIERLENTESESKRRIEILSKETDDMHVDEARRDGIQAAKKHHGITESLDESDQLDEYVGGIGSKIKSKIRQKIGLSLKRDDSTNAQVKRMRDDEKNPMDRNDNQKRKTDDHNERSDYNRLVALHTKVNTMISNDAYTTSRRAVQRTKDGEKVKQPKNDNFENKAFQQQVKAVRDQIKSLEAKVKPTTAKAASKAASAKKPKRTMPESVKEAKENSYTVVHARKGKVVVTAPTSYAAAQKAAKQWKLKSTAGVDSYLMEGSSVKKSESFFSEEMDPTDHVKYNKDTDMYCVYDKDSKKVYESDSEEEANNYAIKNHKSLMGESVELDESMDDTLKRLKKMGGVVFGDKLTSKKDDTPAKLASQSRGKKTVYFVVTDDGYTQYKDLGAVKKAWNIAGNTADAKIALDLMSKQGDGDAIDMILNKYKISIDKLDKIVKNNLGAKSAADFLGESVQLDEVRGKLNAKGEIEMTKANFAKVHKDFKTKLKGQPFAMQIDPKTGGSALFPVKFIKEEVALDEAYQVYVKSRTAKSGWIAQGQPHKIEADAKKDAKSFGGVTKIVKEEVALDEAYQQFTDKTPNWGEDRALTYGRKKGYKEVAVMGNSKLNSMVLFALNSSDKQYVKGANVKSGETIFRYSTRISIAGDIFPLVKVNIAKGIFYSLTQESSEGTIETAKFETKGVKLKFFRSLEGVKLESIEEAVDSADVDQYVATKGDKDSAKMNIIVQLRKAADVKGNIDIVFQDGNRKRIPVNIIKIALDKFNSFKRPANKEKLVNAMSKSYKGMLTALKTIKEYSKY